LKLWNYSNFVVNSQEKVIIFENLSKIGSFSKIMIEWKVMTQMFCNFFTKYERNVDMKYVQEHDFCSKNDQNMTMSNMPK
jgi:hypothetical protein